MATAEYDKQAHICLPLSLDCLKDLLIAVHTTGSGHLVINGIRAVGHTLTILQGKWVASVLIV